MRKYQQEKIEQVIKTIEEKERLTCRKCMDITEINLSLKDNIDYYLDQMASLDNMDPNQLATTSTLVTAATDIQLQDEDVIPLLTAIDSQDLAFQGPFILAGQHITNNTVIKLCAVLGKQDQVINSLNITSLDLSDNGSLNRHSGIYLGNMLLSNKTIRELKLNNLDLQTDGVNRIIECMAFNQGIRSLSLGKISNASMEQLVFFLGVPHSLSFLGFEEGEEALSEENKAAFVTVLEKAPSNRQLMAIHFSTDNLGANQGFVNSLNIQCKINRRLMRVKESQKLGDVQLQPDHPHYLDAHDHEENKVKFSVKKYMQNVFEDILDQGLYLLEKERMNMIRDEKITRITNEMQQLKFKENLRSADGSSIFLARYLISKLDGHYQ